MRKFCRIIIVSDRIRNYTVRKFSQFSEFHYLLFLYFIWFSFITWQVHICNENDEKIYVSPYNMLKNFTAKKLRVVEVEMQTALPVVNQSGPFYVAKNAHRFVGSILLFFLQNSTKNVLNFLVNNFKYMLALVEIQQSPISTASLFLHETCYFT